MKKTQSKDTLVEMRNSHFSPRNIPCQLVKFDEYITTDVICIATAQKSLCLHTESQQSDDNPMPCVCCCAMSKHKTECCSAIHSEALREEKERKK